MVVHIFIGLHYCCDLRGLHGLIYFYSSERISYLKVLMHELKFHTSLRNIVVCLIIKVYFLIFKVLTVENGRRHKDIVKMLSPSQESGVWSYIWLSNIFLQLRSIFQQFYTFIETKTTIIPCFLCLSTEIEGDKYTIPGETISTSSSSSELQR